MFQNPVIVLPGITGATLFDEYPADNQVLWSLLLNKEYERISMHPDNPRYEAREPARVLPGRLFGAAYDDLIAALRHDLSPHADQPTPVFAFPYDWRQGLERVAAQLSAFVDEVIARTRLLRHYDGWASARVDLVGHSMGGLIIAEYLCRQEARGRVGKVATLGTPFRGSIEAVVKLVTGLGSLTGTPPSEREREAARSTPAIYHLLPSFPGSVVVLPGLQIPADLFVVDAWQPSILDSLAEYVRLHAVRPGATEAERATQARQLLAQLLSDARSSRARTDGLSLASLGLPPADWLVVAGADEKTRVSIQIATTNSGPRFIVSDRANGYPGSIDTGDGTVPLAGALPTFVPRQQVVVVIPDDFGFFEVADRTMLGVAGFHPLLPNLNLAQRLVLRHLRPEFSGEIWGRPVPGVIPADWDPPVPAQLRA